MNATYESKEQYASGMASLRKNQNGINVVDIYNNFTPGVLENSYVRIFLAVQ